MGREGIEIAPTGGGPTKDGRRGLPASVSVSAAVSVSGSAAVSGSVSAGSSEIPEKRTTHGARPTTHDPRRRGAASPKWFPRAALVTVCSVNTEATERERESRDAGRGAVFITGAKAYFMVAGAVIEFSLPSLLDAATFGAYAVVVSTISPINNVLVTGTIQAVSRLVARARDRARAIQRAGFAMHARIGVPLAVLFAAAAPLFARFFHDTSKSGPLALAAAICGGYAIYAVFVGTANGMRWFHKQAALDVTMATLRAGGIVGLAAAGFGVWGAISGWVAAVAAILVVSSFMVGTPGRTPGEPQPLGPLVRYFAFFSVYLVVFNYVMFADQMLLKRLSAEWFLASGLGVEEAATAADIQVGRYRAVQNLARLSYQAIIAVTFVVFPLVSRVTFEGDRDAARGYVRTANRYVLIVAAGIAAVFAANPHAMLDLPYAVEYADQGADALVALAAGNVFFALVAVAGTILNAAGRTTGAIVVAAVTLGVAVVGNWLVIPRVAPGPTMLLACALATGGAMLVGAGVGGWMLRRELGGFVPGLTAVRTALAAAGAVGAGRLVDTAGPAATLAEAAGVGVVFLLILLVTREIRGRDLRAVRGWFGRRPS